MAGSRLRTWAVSALGFCLVGCLDPVCWETATCIPMDSGGDSSGDAEVAKDGSTAASSAGATEAGVAASHSVTQVPAAATSRGSGAQETDPTSAASGAPSMPSNTDGAAPSSSHEASGDAVAQEPADTGVDGVADSGVAPTGCATGLVSCDELCVDPLSDDDYCGATAACSDRGVACLDGHECTLGACRGWQEPELVSENAASYAMALDPGGSDFWSFYRNLSGEYTVTARRWSGDWEEPIPLQVTDSHDFFSVRYAAGQAVAAWPDDGASYLRVTHFDGESWSPPLISSFSTGVLVGPDWQGIVWAAPADLDGSSLTPDVESLHFAEWSDGNWETKLVAPTGTQGGSPVANSRSLVGVAWVEGYNIDGSVGPFQKGRVNIATRSSSGWELEVAPEVGPNDDLWAFALGEHSQALTWIARGTDDQVQYLASARIGDGSWSQPIAACGDLDLVCNTTVLTALDDAAILVWDRPMIVPIPGGTETDTRVFAKVRSANGWGPTDVLSQNASGDATSIAVASDGDFAVVAWQESRGVAAEDIRCTYYATTFEQGAWTTARVLSNFDVEQCGPVSVAAANATAIVTWSQDDGSGTRVAYAARYARAHWSSRILVSGPEPLAPNVWLSADGSRGIVDVSTRTIGVRDDPNVPSAVWVTRFW